MANPQTADDGEKVTVDEQSVWYYETVYIDKYCWYLNHNVATGNFLLVQVGYYYNAQRYLVYWSKVKNPPPPVQPPEPPPQAKLDIIVGPVAQRVV